MATSEAAARSACCVLCLCAPVRCCAAFLHHAINTNNNYTVTVQVVTPLHVKVNDTLNRLCQKITLRSLRSGSLRARGIRQRQREKARRRAAVVLPASSFHRRIVLPVV